MQMLPMIVNAMLATSVPMMAPIDTSVLRLISANAKCTTAMANEASTIIVQNAYAALVAGNTGTIVNPISAQMVNIIAPPTRVTHHLPLT